MKITKHITFFYSEKTKHRIIYLNKILNEVNTYAYTTDIYIHTNYLFPSDLLVPNTNGYTTVIVHNLDKKHPFYLTWKCRELLHKQKDDYDIFIYTEDDILIPKAALTYWLENKDELIKYNFNLGFIRIEIDENKEEFMTDFNNKNKKPLDIFMNAHNKTYVLNHRNPYCAMWIYDKNEFAKFIQSDYYNISNIKGYNIREMSAVGLHGLHTDYYKGTVIPLVENQLDNGCRIYHLPNNYIKHNLLSFKNAVVKR